jgi:hypothetical protein
MSDTFTGHSSILQVIATESSICSAIALGERGFRTSTLQACEEYWSTPSTKVGTITCNAPCVGEGDGYSTWQYDIMYGKHAAIDIPLFRNPSCPHTTFPSSELQLEWQTVPQTWFMHISTLPSWMSEPPTSLTSPSLQFDGVIDVSVYRSWAQENGSYIKIVA